LISNSTNKNSKENREKIATENRMKMTKKPLVFGRLYSTLFTLSFGMKMKYTIEETKTRTMLTITESRICIFIWRIVSSINNSRNNIGQAIRLNRKYPITTITAGVKRFK
jgi:hypothetical protein